MARDSLPALADLPADEPDARAVSRVAPFNLALLLACYLLILVVVGSMLFTAHKVLISEIRTTARNLAAFLATQIEPDDIARIVSEEDMRTPQFERILDFFTHAQATHSDIRFLYLLRPVGEGWQFVVDAQPYDFDFDGDGAISVDEEGVKPGEAYEVDEALANTLDQARTRPIASNDFYTDKWGTFISGYAPIYASGSNELLAIVGVDITREQIADKYRLLLIAAIAGVVVLYALVTATLFTLYSKQKSLAVIKMLVDKVYRQNADLHRANEQLAFTVREVNEREQIMNEELALARQIQQRFLPSSEHGPLPERLRFGSHYVPCSSIGGDMIDFLNVSESMGGCYIADVAGHGVSAALVTASLKVCVDRYMHNLRNTLALKPFNAGASLQSAALRDFLANLNVSLREIALPHQFVTFQLVLVDLETKRLTLANAGHNPPLMWRVSDGSVEEIETPSNIPLGLLEEFDYHVVHCMMEPGDKLIAYTDGIIENMNSKTEEFGLDRLVALLKKHGHSSPATISDSIKQATSEFAGTTSPHDDQAMVVLEWNN